VESLPAFSLVQQAARLRKPHQRSQAAGGLGSLLGGGAGGLALTNLLAGGTDISAVIGQAVGGGVLGAVVTAVIGMVLKKK